MNETLFRLGDVPITLLHASLAAVVAALLLLAAIARASLAGGRERTLEAAASAERARELDDKLAELNRFQAEMTGRLQTMAEGFGGGQAALARAVGDRLDAVRHSVGQGFESHATKTHESLSKLNERLALIDRAQANLSDLTNEVLVLKDILANKQTRGAFGQGRMEAIVRDALPPDAYEFQATLTNRARPDCVIHLPGDPRPMVIDAKFPLEAFQAMEQAQTDEAVVAAERRVRNDLGKHVGDIAGRYLLPGETQDMALLFIPSESLYATIAEKFEDVVQKAHRVKVIIVSPSLLMLAIQVVQTLVRDQRMRDQAGLVQKEVRLLLDDVRRLGERTLKLETHFRQAQEDVSSISTSVEKVARRGGRIETLDLAEQATPAAGRLAAE